MAGPKSNVDMFGSYLSRVAPQLRKAARGDAGPEIAILQLLNREQEPVSLREVMANSTIAPSQLMRTINTLRDAKLVELRALGNDEKVALTDIGRKLAGGG